MSEFNQFLSHEAVDKTGISGITADRYSMIAAVLIKQGTPIPTNDIWIAAQTMEFGAKLVTMDPHFKKIPGLIFRLFQ